jgi:GalNAc-alpha-(1->4)-GalNAc-alpha-(1->3)-diNAcBac-PP-undecaprenol alpha-1,4-N-acetyl-D-galactosaminyltransferase
VGGDVSERPSEVARVLFVTKSDGIGGVERKIAGLVATFADRGVVCDLVTLVDGGATPGLLSHIPRIVLAVPFGRGPLQGLLRLRRLRRILTPYDAVVGFGPSPNALVALANRRRGPLAVIAEVGDPFIARRRCWNRWWMWTYRRADVLLVQTERLAAELRSTRRRPKRIVVIPGMLAPIIPVVEPASPRQPVVVAAGRLVASKRCGDLIEAFARLGESAADWRVVFVGDGDERARLERLAVDRGIGSRVEFTGWSDAPWEIMADSSIFVLCSQNEGFATVILEAAASGCALIASDCRFGAREVLGDNESGLLYPVGDIDALSGLLGELIADPERRLALARAAHERARDFGPAAVTGEWLKMIGVEPTA